MTHREAIHGIFDGTAAGPPPVSVRLDLWHADAVSGEGLPNSVEGFRVQEVEDHLGFARAARFSMQPRLEFDAAEHAAKQEGDVTREEYRFPDGTLVRESRRTEEMKRQGIRDHVVQYPLTSQDDYDLMLRHMDTARVTFESDGFAELDAKTGDRGLPMLIAGPCPAHLLMLHLAGYCDFYFHLTDFPDRVAELVQAIEAVFRRDLWPNVRRSQADLVLHGCHFSSQMTPRPLFERFFLPYLSEFSALVHEHGKHVLVHADAEMGDLLDLVVEAGYDGSDCLATDPLTPQRLEDYFAAWDGKVVCWGGLPSIIFDPTHPLDEYKAYVSGVVELTKDRSDFIFGASDNVMPGAEWERLLFLSEMTK